MASGGRSAIGFAAGLLAWGFGSLAHAQLGSTEASAVEQEAVLKGHASGSFEVELVPLATAAEDSTLGRMSIDKHFHGDLEATSRGEMLSAMTGVKGSAGYVAIERVSGTLKGRAGTFVLQHNGIMTRGAPELSVSVVPDSGTDELKGLAGQMTIAIVEGKHFYDFQYTIE